MERPNKRCPGCNADWVGDPIPEESRKYYSPPYYFGREIGIDGDRLGIYDGIVAYRCPDCEEYFPRGDDKWAMEMFKKFKGILDGK